MSALAKIVSVAAKGHPVKLRAPLCASIESARTLHSDMEVPDFSYYRRESTKDTSAKNSENYEGLVIAIKILHNIHDRITELISTYRILVAS